MPQGGASPSPRRGLFNISRKYALALVNRRTLQRDIEGLIDKGLVVTEGAMYTEFVKRDPIAIEQVANALLASQEPEVPLELGDLKTSVRFVDLHFRDLKTILMLNSNDGTTDQVATDETTRWES